MLNLKKALSDELLQLALLLSLMRVDPDAYLGLDMLTIGVGTLNLNNGSGWHTDAHTIIHRPTFVHPKSLDSVLLNYERDLFADLNALGRYNRINLASNDIQAYLLNVEGNKDSNEDIGIDRNEANEGGNSSFPNQPEASQTTEEDENQGAELTQEDMDLIESLWKQDEDMGLTLADFMPKSDETTCENELEDEKEKLKALEAINAANDKKNDPQEEAENQENDPWNGLSYTIDVETGEYILTSSSSSSSSSVSSSEHLPSSSVGEAVPDELPAENPVAVKEAEKKADPPQQQQPNQEPELDLEDDFGLVNDFASDLLDEGLLGDTGVDGLLSNDSLGLSNVFNLEEALQLIDLDEAELQKKSEQVKPAKKKSGEGQQRRSETRASASDLEGENDTEDFETDEMIHPPQFSHAYPSHHRSYQSRTFGRSMDQRWPDIPPYLPVSAGSEPAYPYPPHHHHHHHHHHGYTGLGLGHYEPPRNVLIHNASLGPPVGDLNNTGTYHNSVGTSNLGSAVATSMNLTNSTEGLGPDNGGYKTEPNDMMYFHNQNSDVLNQTDFFWNDEDFGNLEMPMNVGDGLYNGSSGAAAIGGSAMPGTVVPNPGVVVPTPTAMTNLLPPVTDERMDASSDSAVSSMGSERVPSLSDGGEWMETGSNSSHTQADSHYSMDYASKYRTPYDCNYPMEGRGANVAQRCHADRSGAGMGPGARKKYELYGKRCLQEQPSTVSPLAATAHPSTPIKYEYDPLQAVAAAPPPGHAYSEPIEGAAGTHSKIKYSYGMEYSRHHTGRSSLEQAHHNHTYHLPPESNGPLQRPISRDKKAKKGDTDDQHLTRDEKRARALNVPMLVSDIINLPMDEFNERLSKYDLSEAQISLIRDIRRRGKNKVAAQNCRKRKLDQILSLADQVKEMRDRKNRLVAQREYLMKEREEVKRTFSQLYRHVMQSLRDPTGRPYNQNEWSLQQSADGSVVLVPKANQTGGNHYGRTLMDPKGKSNHDYRKD